MALTATSMEPAFPELQRKPLEHLALTVVEKAASLKAKVRPQLLPELVQLTRWMHCYYSNAIEGQPTRLRDIEAAMKNEFAATPKQREMQQLAQSHLNCQEWASTYEGSPFAPEFLKQLHLKFYIGLPQSMRVATTEAGESSPLTPGEFRDRDVIVGTHVPPPHEIVPELLQHFQWRYDSADHSRIKNIIGIAASHHRLAWIHPFRDGNGRVARLFSDKLIQRFGIDAGGLWSLSRGFALHKAQYYAALTSADQERSSSSAADGRGHLSEIALFEFCRFTLETMLDQIAYMDGLLELHTLEGRIKHFIDVEKPLGAGTKQQHERAFLLLREALVRGEFARGEAARIIGGGERLGREVLNDTIKAGLLKSASTRAPVRLALPASIVHFYFPRLFPLSA